MENHYIVCGYGEMGQIIAGELHKQKIPVVIIEPDELALAKLREKDFLHLSGDATDENNLISAGIQPRQRFGIGSQQGFGKCFIVLTARDLNKELLIFARAGSAGTGKRLLKAGADRIVEPYAIGATRIAHYILRPTVTDFLELALSGEGMELGMEEIRIPENSELVGMELMASGLRSDYDLIVVAIKRAEGTMIFNPPPQEMFHAGDTLVVIGPVGNLSRFGQDQHG